jgi:hypothetical protein
VALHFADHGTVTHPTNPSFPRRGPEQKAEEQRDNPHGVAPWAAGGMCIFIPWTIISPGFMSASHGPTHFAV